MSEFGGVVAECKGSQDGKLDFKSEWKGLSKVEGLEGVSVHVDAVVNTGAKKDALEPKVGVSFTNDQIITKNYVSASSVPVFESETSWAACSHFMVGEKMVCDRVKKDYKFELALAGHFEKTMQYGSLVKFANKDGKFGGYNCALFFNQESGDNTVGSAFAYDFDKKSYAVDLGLKMDKGDHTWKFKVNDSGLMHAALQWKLH